jgi:hypothetical protein
LQSKYHDVLQTILLSLTSYQSYRTCSTSLSSHTLETTSLLSALAAAGFLDGGLVNIQAGRWKDVLAKGLGEVLDKMSVGWVVESEDEVGEILVVRDSATDVALPYQSRTMKHIFKLLPKLHKASSSYITALSDTLRTLISSVGSRSEHDLRAEFASKPLNTANVLASALACVADLKDLDVDMGDIEQQLKEAGDEIVQKLGWHRQVLREMARLAAIWQDVDE